MNLIQARRFIRKYPGNINLPCVLAMSGELGVLPTFVKAKAAALGYRADIRSLPFGTLMQYIEADSAKENEIEVFILMPWDLIAECDWRSGIPANCSAVEVVIERANRLFERVNSRPTAHILYLPAEIPPIFSNMSDLRVVEGTLLGTAARYGCSVLEPSAFSLSGYLGIGCAIATDHLWKIADTIVHSTLGTLAHRKVLATDCDGVLWNGLVAEDGLNAIRFHPEGVGFKHFLYQTQLRRMKRDGVLLAAVTRNRLEDIEAALALPGMGLLADDFIDISAGYDTKSTRLQRLSDRLNLALESIVFVDDNPIEIAEVSHALPQVTCLQFPKSDVGLPQFMNHLGQLFSRKRITEDDQRRTELYRMREVVNGKGQSSTDIDDFLLGLSMRLVVRDAGPDDLTRPVQLINKTNQFNLNGHRLDHIEVVKVLEGGGRLLSARLIDRTGDHGEILSCLIAADGIVESYVLSCRVFQRKIEYAFLAWLASETKPPYAFRYKATPRNEPARIFFEDAVFQADLKDGLLLFDPLAFLCAHGNKLKLMSLVANECS